VKERLSVIQNQLKNGASQLEIADDDFEMWVKYHRAFAHYSLLQSKPRDFKTQVYVIQGPTGTGKSKWAQDNYPNAFWKPRSNWWDGYCGQDAVVLDEFYGWIPYDQLLRLTDRYPLNVEIKGGSINFNSKYIIITTNKNPMSWYTNIYFPAFARRVEKWIIINHGTMEEYTDFNEARFIEL